MDFYFKFGCLGMLTYYGGNRINKNTTVYEMGY